MKRGELVNDQNRDIVVNASTNQSVLCGHEAQAVAFEKLTKSLDQYIEHVERAELSCQEILRVTTQNYNREIKEATQRNEDELLKIQSQFNEVKSEIVGKHRQRLKEAVSDRQRVEHGARSTHQNRVTKAKKKRNESVWLADTVLESALRREEIDQKQRQSDLAKCIKNIATIEQALIDSLGLKLTRTVSEAPSPDHPRVSGTSFDGLADLIGAASDAVVEIRVGWVWRLIQGRKKIIELGTAAKDKIENARSYADSLSMDIEIQNELRLQTIRDKHRAEIEKADSSMRDSSKESERKTGALIKETVESFEKISSEIESRRDQKLLDLDEWCATQTGLTTDRHQAATLSAEHIYASKSGEANAENHRVQGESDVELQREASYAMSLIDATTTQAASANPPWHEMPDLQHPVSVPQVVRFAGAKLDLRERLLRVDQGVRDRLGVPERIDIPAVCSLPGPMSLLLTHEIDSRNKALGTMRAIMTRILASFPAGKARFVMSDPIGIGQSFAGFMRLSDQDPSPVGQCIWVDPQHIERQLADITEHMQTVIQKYLRTDYATIEDYNEAAGEIAEPYRFVIIADLHAAITETSAGRLKSILESGPRCGVYAILATQADAPLPAELENTLESCTLELLIGEHESTINDQRVKEVSFEFDQEPSDQLASEIFDRVARAGADAGRVEVPFERLSPADEQIWSRTCEEELVIPIGRSGAQKNQELRLGLGTRQHALIAGRTGSGKSTLLHVIITAAAMWYSPDELEMYLIDFKKGVEFKAYTGGRMPHARAIAIESDREFGLSVLKRLDDELTERGDLFRTLGAQSLESARSMAPQERLPRVLLLIDEFQEFFTEDDEVASEATLLLDRLVRQGRAFGVHVVLGSQTLAGAYSLARSTLGQIGVRVALQCSETDSYLILGEDNSAARLLERPGEAIYNNAGGLVEGNSPFQTAWLPDTTRDQCLDLLPKAYKQHTETVVFEGNKPADLELSAIAFADAFPNRNVPRLLLGDAIAIAPPVAPSLNRRSGANLLIVGPQTEPAMGMLFASSMTFSASPQSRIIFVDPTPEDDNAFGLIARLFSNTGLNIEVVSPDSAVRVVTEINQIVAARAGKGGDPILMILGGVHRLRSLRKSDDFGFSLDEEAVSPDKELANILLEGPPVSVWTAAWCDTLTNLERALDRSSIREFGLRAVMQMSASDSTMLLDSSAASSLGANRAILADEVSGETMKFRPMSPASADAVERVKHHLKASSSDKPDL